MFFEIFKKIRSFLIKLGIVDNSIVNSLGRRILIKLKPKYVVEALVVASVKFMIYKKTKLEKNCYIFLRTKF